MVRWNREPRSTSPRLAIRATSLFRAATARLRVINTNDTYNDRTCQHFSEHFCEKCFGECLSPKRRQSAAGPFGPRSAHGSVRPSTSPHEGLMKTKSLLREFCAGK